MPYRQALRTLPSTLVYLSVFGGGPILVVLMSTLLLGERYGVWVGTATIAGICGICMHQSCTPVSAAPAAPKTRV